MSSLPAMPTLRRLTNSVCPACVVSLENRGRRCDGCALEPEKNSAGTTRGLSAARTLTTTTAHTPPAHITVPDTMTTTTLSADSLPFYMTKMREELATLDDYFEWDAEQQLSVFDAFDECIFGCEFDGPHYAPPEHATSLKFRVHGTCAGGNLASYVFSDGSPAFRDFDPCQLNTNTPFGHETMSILAGTAGDRFYQVSDPLYLAHHLPRAPDAPAPTPADATAPHLTVWHDKWTDTIVIGGGTRELRHTAARLLGETWCRIHDATLARRAPRPPPPQQQQQQHPAPPRATIAPVPAPARSPPPPPPPLMLPTRACAKQPQKEAATKPKRRRRRGRRGGRRRATATTTARDRSPAARRHQAPPPNIRDTAEFPSL
jgi:hypothetical protein